jgi:hypothetical protein
MDYRYLPPQIGEKLLSMDPKEAEAWERKIRHLFDRSKQYSHKQMQDCLKPMNLDKITP